MYRWILNNELYRLYLNFHELKNNTANVKIFKSRIREAWERIDQAHKQRLVESIPARLDACRNSEDGVLNIDSELSSYQIY